MIYYYLSLMLTNFVMIWVCWKFLYPRPEGAARVAYYVFIVFFTALACHSTWVIL